MWGKAYDINQPISIPLPSFVVSHIHPLTVVGTVKTTTFQEHIFSKL